MASAKFYGQRAPGVQATDTTLFNLASVTKLVTTEGVLRLAAASAPPTTSIRWGAVVSSC